MVIIIFDMGGCPGGPGGGFGGPADVSSTLVAIVACHYWSYR